MPIDAYDDEEDEKKGALTGSNTRIKDFDCPTCNANNPIDFGDGDELLCNYCGTTFVARVNDSGKAKLRET